MTTTPSTDLQELLAARRGDVAPPCIQDAVDDGAPPVDVVTGEILPAGGGGTAPPPPAVALEPVQPSYTPDYSLLPPKVLGGLPYASEYMKLAKTICSTEMVPEAFKGWPDKTFAAIMRGVELGLPPFQALASFNVIRGNVGLKAEAMRALIFNAGHSIIVRENRDESGTVVSCTAECKRAEWDRSELFTYSMDDARQEGLAGGDNYKKRPRAMLDARATSGAGRRWFADVLAGMSYTPEELMEFGRGQTVEREPEPVTEPAPVHDEAPATPPVTLEKPLTPPTEEPSPKRKRGRPTKEEAAARKAQDKEEAEARRVEAQAALEAQEAAEAPPEVPQPPPVVTPEEPEPEPEEPPPAPPREPDPVQSPLGETPSMLPGEGAVLSELRKSLSQLMKAQPELQQGLLRSFLGRHFPGKKAIDLDADELTTAINIAGGWPESADTYPAPEPEGF